MNKTEFSAQLERAATTMPGLPVSQALARRLSEELKSGDPAWWQSVAQSWEKRKFVAWTEAWGLFLTAVHFEALNDAKNALVPYFPSCGGTDEADPSLALSRFLGAAPASFYEHLRSGHRRSYVEARAQLWLAPAMLFFQARRLPYYLVEVNAGAGLNLAADVVAPAQGFRQDLVAARIGLEPQPLLLEDIIHRRWLTAALLPDQTALIKALDKAVDKVRQWQGRDPAFLQIVECEPAIAAKFTAKNIPPEEDVGLLIFNMGATVRMTDAEYGTYAREMAAMMQSWGDRALWIEVESVRGEIYSTTYQLRAHRILGGQLRTHVMAAFDFGARKTDYDSAQTAKFLAVSGRK